MHSTAASARWQYVASTEGLFEVLKGELWVNYGGVCCSCVGEASVCSVELADAADGAFDVVWNGAEDRYTVAEPLKYVLN